VILHNALVFSPNRSNHSLHYFNITKKNLVKVFPKDTVYGSGSGSEVASGGMLDEEEIMELFREELRVEQEWRDCGYLIDEQEQQMLIDQ
jgi:hypothetical protein